MAELKDRIRQFLENHTGRPPRLHDVMKELKIPPSERKSVRRLIRELQVDGHLSKLRSRAYVSSNPRNVVTGVLRASKRGFRFSSTRRW